MKSKCVNQKVQEHREKIKEKKNQENLKKEKELEDNYWKDEKTKIEKNKEERKKALEKKKEETLAKKKALKEEYEKEMNSLKGKNENSSKKITEYSIQITKEKKNVVEKETQLEELPDFVNINREKTNLLLEGDIHARSIDEALQQLSLCKKNKLTYKEFEEQELELVKMENPALKLQQQIQIVRKRWIKSSANPMNATRK